MITSTKPVCCLDLETTGTDVALDRIIQIAYKIFHGEIQATRSQLVNPGFPIPKAVQELTGITDEMVKDAPRFEQLAKLIHEEIHGCDLVGFNLLNFDVPLLWEEFHRANINWDLTKTAIVDAGNIFKKKERRTLEAAVEKYCGRKHENAHDAMADVLATADVLDGQLFAYDDLGAMSFAQLAEFSCMDELDKQPVKRIDLAGILVRTADGIARYTHKKVRGVAVKDDLGYAGWMLRQNFSANTKLAIERVLNEIRNAGQQDFL